MTAGELKELYVRAAARSRCTPNKMEEGEWKRAFEYADKMELGAAIDKLFETASHSMRGVWMPKVDELRPLVEQEQRKRAARASTQTNFAAWRCPVCRMSCTAFVLPGETTMRNCRRCGAALDLQHWEAGEVTA